MNKPKRRKDELTAGEQRKLDKQADNTAHDWIDEREHFDRPPSITEGLGYDAE